MAYDLAAQLVGNTSWATLARATQSRSLRYQPPALALSVRFFQSRYLYAMGIS